MTRINSNGKNGMYLKVVAYKKPKFRFLWRLRKLFTRIKKDPEPVDIHIDSNIELIEKTENNEN